MVIKKMTEDVFNTLNKHIQTLSSIEKKHFKEKIEQINSKYKSLIELKKTKNSTQEIDTMFFCFEDLPPTGKEYWFMKFASTESEDKRQLIVMFGDGSETIKINKKRVKSKKHDGRNGYMTVWCYDNEKDLVLDGESLITTNPDNIMASDEQGKINYNGKFPNYTLNISKKNKEITDLKITRPENNSESFEFSSHFKSFAGFALINLYFDFTGLLNGKKFTGKCYVQKVMVVGPFVPWYWGRIVFSNGSIISYYEPRIELSILNHKLSSVLTFYDNEKDKKYIFKDLTIKKFGENNPRWIITADKGKVFIFLKSYSSHKFVFEKIGSFTYIEYLSEVTDIFIEDLNIDASGLGSGFGLIEDANGYVL